MGKCSSLQLRESQASQRNSSKEISLSQQVHLKLDHPMETLIQALTKLRVTQALRRSNNSSLILSKLLETQVLSLWTAWCNTVVLPLQQVRECLSHWLICNLRAIQLIRMMMLVNPRSIDLALEEDLIELTTMMNLEQALRICMGLMGADKVAAMFFWLNRKNKFRVNCSKPMMNQSSLSLSARSLKLQTQNFSWSRLRTCSINKTAKLLLRVVFRILKKDSKKITYWGLREEMTLVKRHWS